MLNGEPLTTSLNSKDEVQVIIPPEAIARVGTYDESTTIVES
jgi:hypothetical protein